MKRRKVIGIGDLHLPFYHKDCLDWIISDIIKYEKPDIILQAGDLLDQFGSSRFARSHNVMTPKEEIDSGIALAATMWSKIKKAAPDAMCVQLLGNHDIRPSKRILDAFPEAEEAVEQWMASKYAFKGVKTILDPKQEVEIDGVLYTHGHLSKLGDHMRYYLQSCVHAHTHKGGSVNYQIRGDTLFELDLGYCSDQHAVPMRYGATRRMLWTLGCGKVDKNGGSFLIYPHQPIRTDKVL